jgi:hypothetical protein
MKALATKILTALFTFLCGANAIAVDVPHQFAPNTPASAAEVNENFEALRDGLNATIRSVDSFRLLMTTRENTFAAGYGAVACNANEVVVSASCDCTGVPSEDSNFGVLFACRVAGNAAVGGCYVDSLYDPNLPVSPISVTAQCGALSSEPPPSAISGNARSQKASSTPNEAATQKLNAISARIQEMKQGQ